MAKAQQSARIIVAMTRKQKQPPSDGVQGRTLSHLHYSHTEALSRTSRCRPLLSSIFAEPLPSVWAFPTHNALLCAQLDFATKTGHIIDITKHHPANLFISCQMCQGLWQRRNSSFFSWSELDRFARRQVSERRERCAYRVSRGQTGKQTNVFIAWCGEKKNGACLSKYLQLKFVFDVTFDYQLQKKK